MPGSAVGWPTKPSALRRPEGFPKPSDLPLDRYPVLVIRGADGALRAFMNSCRHRGAPVVRDVEGVTRLLVCHYHSWGYDLAGNLKRLPDERDFADLCKEDRGLVKVRCERWGGFVFVNLDDDAPPLLEWIAPLADRLPEIAAAPLRTVLHLAIRQNPRIRIRIRPSTSRA